MSVTPVLSVEQILDSQLELPLDPPRRLWTREEYYAMAEAGVIGRDEHVELIDGEIVQKMSPQRSPHAAAIRLAETALKTALGSDFEVRSQLPMALEDRSEPEPDILVAKGNPRSFADHHPTPLEVVFLVEISDSSLAFDRGRKARMYAKAGVPEYWIVNLIDRRVEVFTEPVADIGYRTTKIYGEEDSVPVPGIGASEAGVRDLLP